ncbi:MAG: hypothetical protein JW904_15800 [Spirochaetales bacterium]|nr:hypothetical protein [Spirochaetales bacterium]
MKEFTKEELSQFDGKEGRPAYIGFMGIVYDVSKSMLWKEGNHQASHNAGKDLSREIGLAPHGAGVIGMFPVAGKLKKINK